MKRAIALVLLGVFALFFGFVGCLSLMGGINSSQYVASQQQCSSPATTDNTVLASTSDNLFRAIFTVSGSNTRLALSMLVGSYLESGWDAHAVGAGSYGAYQIQHPGVVHPDITIQQALNPGYATNYMAPAYKAALQAVADTDWTRDPAQAAEEVAYNAEKPRVIYHENQGWDKVRTAYAAAQKVVSRGGNQTGTGAGVLQVADVAEGECSQPDQMQTIIQSAIQACLSKQGSDYTWSPPADGASFVSWCFQQAGVKMPANVHNLANWKGDSSSNLTATWLSASQVESDQASLQPGDIPFWSGHSSSATQHDVMRTGLFVGNNTNAGTSFSLATWNIKTGAGYQSRVDLAASLIPKYDLDIVGFQEVEHPEIYRAIASAFKGSKYALYPSPPGAVYRNSLAARSILYNTDRFELLPQTDEIQFRRTYDPQQPAHAPVIRLRDKATGQVIIVANTHSPAFERFAKQRYEAGLAYVQKFQQLSSEGLPMFFTGDFNSGYWTMTSNNVTYQNDRNNLTYCQLTANGLMDDARDVAQGLSGYCPRRPGNGSNTVDHIYVSPGVHVSKTYEIQHVSDHNAVVANVSVPATTTSGQQTSDLGQYVGPNPAKGNRIDVASVSQQHLAGVLRLTYTTPTPKVGQGFIGNDGFTGGSCVVYVEYILSQHSSRYHGQVDITSGTQGIAAYTVASNLGKQLGYAVNNVPAVHAVVSFGTSFANPSYGHVAIVAQVNPDGSIVVEEANWDNVDAYGTHLVPASEVPNLTYAHTEVGWH